MTSISQMHIPERTKIGGSLEIPRMINGLWQLAGGHDADVEITSASKAMDSLILAGLDAFDMADHYGDAELVIGHHQTSSDLKATAFTKWCPTSKSLNMGQQTKDAIDLALRRMGQKKIDLLQYHSWDYSDRSLLHHLYHLRALQEEGKIGLIGLTNIDAAHLELLIDSGFTIATNQVSCSVIDRRVVRGRLSEVCEKHHVGILAYGTLLGGFISEKWLGVPEPSNSESLNWSLRKYLRFIKAAGGWGAFQGVLEALSTVAKIHGVSMPAVATRFVLDIPVVSAVIVGTRLSSESSQYIQSNLSSFSFNLSKDDHALIAEAQEKLRDIPGDCGDEYRRPPVLTATGDLSHHLGKSNELSLVAKAAVEGRRIEYCSGSKWEPIAGYCRAVRTSNTIRISGTTANSPISSIPVIGGFSPRSQTVAALDIIEHALKSLGSSLKDVVRTRIMIRNKQDWEEVSKAHGWVFGCVGIKPANTLITAGLIGEGFLVEIEAEAEVGSGDNGIVNLGDSNL